MIKPLLLAGVLLLAGAGTAGALCIAPLGGEEEVLQTRATPRAAPTTAPTEPPPPTSTVTAAPAPATEPSRDSLAPAWLTYTDPVIGLSFPYPPKLTSVEEKSERGLEGQEDQRFIAFRTAQAEVGLVLVVIPVGDLGLTGWVDFYTACGGDAGAQEEEVRVAGEPALRCPIDQLNQRNPSYYLKWRTYIIEVFGNLSGSREGGGYLPPVLTDVEMQNILDGVVLPTADT